MLPDEKYPTSNYELKNLEKYRNHGHKSKRNDNNQWSQSSDKSLKASKERNVSHKTLMTNDEQTRKSMFHPRYQQPQFYIQEDIDDAFPALKNMDIEEVTMSLTGKPLTIATSGLYNEENFYNQQFEASSTSATNDQCNYRHHFRGSEYLDVVGKEATTCSLDDANNHLNFYDDQHKVMADNNVNVAAHNSNDYKQIPDVTTATLKQPTAIVNNNLLDEKYHKVPHKTIDSDDGVEDTKAADHGIIAPRRRSDETNVVDNSNDDNVKHKEHHKTLYSHSSSSSAAGGTSSSHTKSPTNQTTSSTMPAIQYNMSLNNIKQEEYVAGIMESGTTTTMVPSLMTSDIPFPSSFQNSENHKIQNHQPIHQATFSDMQQSYHPPTHYPEQNQYYHPQHYQVLSHSQPYVQHQQQYFAHLHQQQQQQQQFLHQHHPHQNQQPSLQQYISAAVAAVAPSQNVFPKNYGTYSTDGDGAGGTSGTAGTAGTTESSSATTSLTIW